MQDPSFHMMTKQVSLLFLQKPQTLIFSGVEASYGSQVGSRRSLDGEKILTSDLGLSLSTRWAPRCSSESHSHRQIHSQISRNYLRDSCQKHPIIFPLSNGRSWPLILPSSGKVTLSSWVVMSFSLRKKMPVLEFWIPKDGFFSVFREEKLTKCSCSINTFHLLK